MSVCEASGCDTDVTAASSGPEKRFCSGKCRAKAKAPLPRGSGSTIPGDVFRKCIAPLMASDDDPVQRLAAACNVKADSLYRALQRDHLDFDLCDLILCKLNAVHAWWSAPLDEFYWNLELVG